MINLIVMDLDGTLLDDEKNISKYTLNILKECRFVGIKLAFATSRSESSSKRFIDLVSPDIVIVNNGALIKIDNKIFCKELLQKEIAEKIIKEIYGRENVGEIKFETENGYYIICANEEDAYIVLGGKYKYLPIGKKIENDLLKIRLELFDEKMVDEIKTKYNECDIIGFSNGKWYMIKNKEANKINAIRDVIKEIKVPINNVCAFGDDYNDIEMIKNCGMGIAMENGIDEIKKVAKYRCKKNNEDGVGKWIEENILK
jgi:Cof subfamily protein (haloacid dehalogenase superfamily)